MKSRNVHLMLLPCIGFALVVLTGCENTVTLGMGNYGKVILYPMNGDTLKWPFPVSFQGVAWPCEGPKQSTTQACKINVQYAPGQTVAKFHYNCSGCTDPELDVGPSTGLGATGTQAATPTPPDQIVVIECNAGTIAADPSTTKPLKKDQTIDWSSDGGNGVYIAKWTVTTASGVCREPAINQSAIRCTILTTTPNDYAYTVHDTSGACKDVTGTIKVVAP